tara:strand:- start:4385 stop:5374 length:990 start_codon:yes stop_codon:yes gene_type:complete
MESQIENLKSRIFFCDDFDSLALEVFRFQALNNEVYARYLDLLKVDPFGIQDVSKIPFLPVEAFKNNQVKTGKFNPEVVFKSSGTSGTTNRSKHFVKSINWYHQVSEKIYCDLVGEVKRCDWVGLLPGYLERGDSSLVEMVRNFMKVSGSSENFFLHDYSGLNLRIKERYTAVFGVTHAILSWLEGNCAPNPQTEITIIETGGMKGHGREPVRSEVHQRISRTLPKAKIISEYGMTELLSQAYAVDGKYFESPRWMKVLIKDTADPMNEVERGRTGRVQIIDLANIDSCSFISTSDLGRLEPVQGSTRFEILGRFDHSEVRGCNLLSVN